MLDELQRRELLHAMGIDVYRWRDGALAEGSTQSASSSAPAPTQSDAGGLALVIACPADHNRDAAAGRLRALLPLALGVPDEHIRWISADPRGALPEPPAARAYLALGREMPRALGANLSTMQQMSALIAAADEPAASLRNGLSKRALWQALKPLARQLRGSLH